MLPFLKKSFSLLHQHLHNVSDNFLIRYSQCGAYSLLSGLPHILISFKERSDILSLTPPDMTVYSPIQRKLKTSTIQRAACSINQDGGPIEKYKLFLPHCLLASHDNLSNTKRRFRAFTSNPQPLEESMIKIFRHWGI